MKATSRPIIKEDFSFDELNNCLHPLLVKLSNNAPKHSDCRLGLTQMDGGFLRFTSKNSETLYKVVGSEYHAHEKAVYLNIVKQDKHYHSARQGELILRIEVSCNGSVEDLEAQIMAQYDVLNERIQELYND